MEYDRVMHRQREGIVARVPVHMTIRLRRDVPTLRQPRFVRRFRSSLSEACVRHDFRVVHYSIQRDHVHLLIEAQSNYSIACGMKSVGARIVEVHRALRYVLLNHGHHAAKRRPTVDHVRAQPDPASSGRWFAGWRIVTAPPNPTDICEIAPARTWLLRTSWRRHGLVHPADVP